MSLRTNSHATLALLVAVGASTVSLLGQGALDPQGGEYLVAGTLPGDQVNARISLDSSGGYLVWQDSHTDGDGSGISGVMINGAGTPAYEVFRINSQGLGNQENPGIARLADGSHLVVWQGGTAARQDIFARAINPEGLFATQADVLVNTHLATGKLSPAVAALEAGNAVVTWASHGQDDPENAVRLRRGLQGVYAQVLTPAGDKVGGEILVNGSVEFNQRTPAVAGLADNKFVVVWITERLSGFGESEQLDGVDVMGRIFAGADGQPLTQEFRINTSTNICAHPTVTGTLGGGFTVAWSERDIADQENSWDVAARHFDSSSPASGRPVVPVNTHRYGDQYRPVISGGNDQQMVVWSSMGQDGSHEGVYGQFLSLGQKNGGEFLVNSTTVSRQILPAVAAQGSYSFTVVWSSFVGGLGGMDLLAQRYATGLPKPGAPVVNSLSSYELLVAWPEMAGFEVAEYLLYVNGALQPVVTAEIFYKLAGLNPGTVHSFRLAYRLTDGRSSPLSNEVSGRTWGADLNFDGLPDDWQEAFFGGNPALWPSPWVDSDGDGVSNRDEFFAGTNPGDIASALKLALTQTPQGWKVVWDTTPGQVYRLQSSSDFQQWDHLGGYRFAAGQTDSSFIEPAAGMAYYRIIRIR